MVTALRTAPPATVPESSLRAALARLWIDHVLWTRQYIVAAVAGSPDAEAAAGRLLRNQEDIGNAVVPFYGEEAGAALTTLLKDHIMIAVGIVAASLDDDEDAALAELARWDANADALAELLAGANPENWPLDDVRDLLGQHLALTKRELLARLNDEWDDDIAAFDDILTEILTMASALSEGLIAQFPDRF
ncbi:MAG TPA: glycosyltransferase, partial [Actinomycetota bacterium]|nr:glycosyltransferase [Actinomycetota bacterium]